MKPQTRLPTSRLALWRELASDAFRFGAVEVKNFVKRVLGRRPYRNVYHQHRARLLGLLASGRRIHAVSCTEFHDHEGAGSRALMTMYTIAFCRETGVAYYHTPMRDLRHADRPQDEFDAMWEDFFQLGQGETPVEDSPVPVFDLIELTSRWMGTGGDFALLLRPRLSLPRPSFYLETFYLQDGPEKQRLMRQFAGMLESMAPEFRRRFRTGTPARKNRLPVVAVHIRRGDVNPDTPFMWTELDSFARAISDIRTALDELGVTHEVHIHTQGDPAHLAALEGEGVRIFADAAPEWTLRELIEADVLVMSKSCFSYIAAMLGDSLSVFEECRLPPFSGWIMREADGSIPHAELRQQLAERFSAQRP